MTFKFVAVAEWKLDQAKKFAQRHGIPKAYGGFEQLAQDPEVEIVYIAIVNPYHYSMAKLMLENGKHVLIEKPMTLNRKSEFWFQFCYYRLPYSQWSFIVIIRDRQWTNL